MSGAEKTAALPAWMYADPAEVVERIELQALAKAKREAAKRRAHEVGLTPNTVHWMRRLRIQELVKQAKGASHDVEQ